MTSISIRFAGITTDRLGNSLTSKLNKKGLRINSARFILRS
jgi:hypothetical protein